MIKPLNILDATVNCVDYQGYTHNVAEGNIIHKINVLIKTVNKLQEYVQGAVDNSIKDGAYIQNLEEDVKALRDDCNLLMGYIAPEDGCKPSEEDLCNMVKDPKYWKEQDPETVRKVELAFQKKYGENTQNSTNNSEKLHLFQGNEHFADVSKKIKRAADSANKNLDNALDVAVDALKRIAEPESWSPIYAEQIVAKDALKKISEILKITKGE